MVAWNIVFKFLSHLFAVLTFEILLSWTFEETFRIHVCTYIILCIESCVGLNAWKERTDVFHAMLSTTF